MRILVTGSSGMIGSALVRKLSDSGYEVIAVDRTAAKDEGGGYNQHHGRFIRCGSDKKDS